MSTYYGDADELYLQRAAELLRQPKQRSYDLMHIQPGATVLDVGCGPGTDTILLAQFVGPTGQVIGIDFNSAFVAQADERAVQTGVANWVSHRQADATSLPFESESFDACRSERLLQHLHHPEQAVGEMVRVTRSGGWIVLMDAEYAMVSIDSPETDIERRLARFNAEIHNSGYAGRQIYRWLKSQHITDITIEMVPVYFTEYAFFEQMFGPAELVEEAVLKGSITEEEAQRWKASLVQADAEGVFFASVPGVLIAGRKP